MVITLIAVQIGWIFFASRTIEQALEYIKSIINPVVFESNLFDARVIALILLVIIGNFLGKYAEKILVTLLRKINIFSIILIILLTYILLKLGPDLVAPFVYFSF